MMVYYGVLAVLRIWDLQIIALPGSPAQVAPELKATTVLLEASWSVRTTAIWDSGHRQAGIPGSSHLLFRNS
jgi:hypothetical protein